MIIGISGRKQSGKTTSANFLASIFMGNLNIAQKIKIGSEGEIVVSDILGNNAYAGKFDLSVVEYSNDYLHKQAMDLLNPNIKIYSFADPLKKNICMDLLGLTYDQCYGSDSDKNTLTNIKWSDMPEYNISWTYSKDYDPSGYMTARQVMEFIGTGIFRKIKSDIWVEATLSKIKKDKAKIAVIVDCRFPNEIEAITKNSGKTIRLTKNPFNSMVEAETALDRDKYDWSKFDFIVDNEQMTIYDQCIELQKILQEVISL
jgi:hypothetical protein